MNRTACILALAFMLGGCAAPALYRPAEQGDLPRLRALLSAGADPNETKAGYSGVTALHMAAANSRLEAARLLIAGGADVNKEAVINGSRRARPLHYAACSGDAAMVQLLLESGADPEPGGGECAAPGWSVTDDIVMRSPLELARLRGHEEAASLIKAAIDGRLRAAAGGARNAAEYAPLAGGLLQDYSGAGRTVAVAGFSYSDGRASSDGGVVSERLTTELIKQGKMKVVERREIEKVLGELKLQVSGGMDQDSAKKLGRMLGADLLVVGTITALPGGTLEVNARLADVGSGQAVSAVSGRVARDWTAAGN